MPPLTAVLIFLTALWPQGNRPQQLSELAYMRTKWESRRPHAYEFCLLETDTMSVGPPGCGLTRTHVVNNAGALVGHWSHAVGRSASTIDDLFDDVQKRLEQQNNQLFTIEFEGTYGYPRIHRRGLADS